MTSAIRRGYIDNLYGQLHYRIARPEGPASHPPLLCLHQSPQSGWEWEPLMRALSVDRVVVAPDTPGYGYSDAPPAPVLIEDFARAMMRFMDDMTAVGELDGQVFDVIGYHTGSVTATQLARANPDRVRKIVVIGLAAYDAPTRAAKLEKLDAFPTPKGHDLSHVTRLWDLMGSMVDKRASYQWRHMSLAQGLLTGERLPWGFSAVYNFDFIGAMEAVKQPALIVNLEDDLFKVTPLHAGRFVHGRRVDLLGASHGVLTLDTDSMAKLVGGFLDEA